MAHCININSPEYISLAKQSKLGQRELKARIAAWQELTGKMDEYPSLNEVETLLDKDLVLPKRDIEYNKPNRTVKSVDSYAQAKREVAKLFNPSDISDFSKSISILFSNVIDYYQQENPFQTREEVINSLTPALVFEAVRNELEVVLYDLKESNADPMYVNNLQTVLDNWKAMATVASRDIALTEGLRFDTQTYEATKVRDEVEDNLGESNTEVDEMFNKEEEALDGWMNNAMTISVGETLSKNVIRLLNKLPLKDSKGNVAVNKIGLEKKLDWEIVKNDILKAMQEVIYPQDLFTALSKMQKTSPWVEIIKEALVSDNELFANFYHTLKKDFTSLNVILTQANDNGVISYKIKESNTASSLNNWVKSWQEMIGASVVVNPIYSVFKSDGTFNREAIDSNNKILAELKKEWNKIKDIDQVAERKKFIKNKTITLRNQLLGLGINITDQQVRNILSDVISESAEFNELNSLTNRNYSVDNLIQQMQNIYRWLNNKENVSKTNTDLVQNNRKNYRKIAEMLVNNDDLIMEASTNEGNKGYYAYQQPSYLSKLIKELKNIKGDKKAFEKFLDENFRQFPHLYDTENKRFRISWLNDLADTKNGAANRALLSHSKLLSFNRTEYSKQTDIDYTLSLLTNYFLTGENAWYHVPVLADAPVGEFIKYKKIQDNYKENVVEHLYSVFEYEWDRIKTVNARKAGIADGSIKAIDNYDSRGDRFIFLEFLNGYDIETLINENNSKYVKDAIKELIIQNLDTKFNESLFYLNNLGIFEQNKTNNFIYLEGLGLNKENMRAKLEEYFYNSYLATTNIIQLTSTDLAYFKNADDFIKRNKQIHAPGNNLNTEVMYDGKRVFREGENYTFITVEDEFADSSDYVYNNMKTILANNKVLSKAEKDKILKLHKNNGRAHNLTDGQGIRSLDSARKIIAASTGWNDRLERAYQNIKNNTWSIQDYNIVFEAFKLYLYTQRAVDSRTLKNSENAEEGNVNIKVPLQHKYAETILFPAHKEFNQKNGKVNPKISGLMNAMEKGNIDLVVFKSVEKVGSMGALDLSKLTGKELTDYVLSHKENDQIFKKVDYNELRVQQPTVSHLVDSESLHGVQIRKIMTSNLGDNSVFKIGDETLNKQELVNLYNKLITENLLESYNKLLEHFGSKQNLHDIIKEELLSSTRYASDLINAIQLDSDGNFELPLYDPSQSYRVQQLLNSIWKSRINKQKRAGGKAVHVSNYGYENDLSMVYKEVDGKPVLDCIECFIPLWTNKLPSNWDSLEIINEKNGLLDIDKMLELGIIDEEFIKFLGYRIPTEDKYSMLPLKVKGFLPKGAGSNIILPREATTIMGIDFDIDSLYLFFKEFEYNYETNKLEVVQTDEFLKDVKPENLTKAQRNNLLLDLELSVLNHEDSSVHQIAPGNFDELKLNARKMEILSKDLKTKDGVGYTLEMLNKMDLKQLDKILNDSVDLLDFTTQIYMHGRNTTAGALISIAATANSNNAIRQFTKIEVTPYVQYAKDENGNSIQVAHNRFNINGKFYTSLHDELTPNKDAYISRRFATILAAAVDAVKDPIFNMLNVNEITANTYMLLTGLGYDSMETGLFMRQPAIMKFVNDFNRRSKTEGITKYDLIDELIEGYKKDAQKMGVPIIESDFIFDNNNLSLDALAKSLSVGNANNQNKSAKEIGDFIHTQYAVLMNFKNLEKTAQELSDFIGATRADSSGAGPTFADNTFKNRRVEKNRKNANSKYKILSGTDIIDSFGGDMKNIDALREFFDSQTNNLMQPFVTLGLEAPKDMFKQYFPHFKSEFEYIFNTIEPLLKTGRLTPTLMNNIFNDFFTYYLSQTERLSRESGETENFLQTFPLKLYEMKAKNQELADMFFIKNLSLTSPTTEIPFPRLQFIAGTKLSPQIRDKIMGEWESLLYMGQEYHDLALDLMKYSYFINGFNFGSTSFMHLAPTAVKSEFPGYVSNLESLTDIDISTENLKTFIFQYYRNHLNNKGLVSQVNNDNTDIFIDNNDQMKEFIDTTISPTNRDFFNLTNPKDPILLPYVSVKYKDSMGYYKVDSEGRTDNLGNLVVEFTKVEPLGIPNQILAYDYANSDYNWNSNPLTKDMIKEKYSEFKSESEKQQERGTVEMEESVDLFGESYDVETTTTQEAVLALESFKAMIFAKYKDNSGSDSRLDSLSESDMGVSNYFESKAVANFEASVQEANNTQDNNTLDALEAKNKDLIDEAEKFCG